MFIIGLIPGILYLALIYFTIIVFGDKNGNIFTLIGFVLLLTTFFGPKIMEKEWEGSGRNLKEASGIIFGLGAGLSIFPAAITLILTYLVASSVVKVMTEIFLKI